MEKTNVVYLHVKKGTNDVFYVGIGKNKRRAYSTYNRNNYWHNVVNKYDYDIRVINSGLSREDACYIEKELIATFGDQLVNLTNGGEGGGFKGRSHTEESKMRQSKMRIGVKKSEETKKRMSEAKKRCAKYGVNNHRYNPWSQVNQAKFLGIGRSAYQYRLKNGTLPTQ